MVKLSVLDLGQISQGNTVAQTLRNTIELAQHVEELGYHRFWLGEHHNARIASSAPTVLIGQIAAATHTIRVGSGAVLTGPLSASTIVEQFGTLAEFYPRRIDMGLGKSNDRIAAAKSFLSIPHSPPTSLDDIPDIEIEIIDDVVIVKPRNIGVAVTHPSYAWSTLLPFPSGADGGKFVEQIFDIISFIKGTYRCPDGTPIHVIPGEGTDLMPYILGSSPGESCQVATQLGLPFVASYHLITYGIAEAAHYYRQNFVPGMLAEPYVIVSADVLVAEDKKFADHLAFSAWPWIRNNRVGKPVTAMEDPETCEKLDDLDTRIIADRIASRIVGTPEYVVQRLAALAKFTGADELLIITHTYDLNDKLRSFELLTQYWQKQFT